MKLSIVTINYNNKAGLQKTIDSIMAQSCSDYEWIVIDGASDDGSADVIKEYSDHMAYWVSEPDTGIYNAMNKGLVRASGDYIQFLNSGDYYYDDRVIERFINSQPTGDVMYGRAMIVDADGNEIREWGLPTEPLHFSFFWNYNLNHQATFFAKRCFETLRFNESHRINSDKEMFMRLVYMGYSFRYYDSLVVKYDNCGISSTCRNVVDEFNDTIDKMLPVPLQLDYNELVQYRDVDLHIMMQSIINSNRIIRNFTRAIVYPIYYLSKILNK